jgi:hypothetical protein
MHISYSLFFIIFVSVCVKDAKEMRCFQILHTLHMMEAVFKPTTRYRLYFHCYSYQNFIITSYAASLCVCEVLGGARKSKRSNDHECMVTEMGSSDSDAHFSDPVPVRLALPSLVIQSLWNFPELSMRYYST